MATPQPALPPPRLHWKQGESELTLYARNQALLQVRRQRQGWVVDLPDDERGARTVVVRSAAAGVSLANKWARARRAELAGRGGRGGARSHASLAPAGDPARLLAEVRALREVTGAMFAWLDRMRDRVAALSGAAPVAQPPCCGTRARDVAAEPTLAAATAHTLETPASRALPHDRGYPPARHATAPAAPG